MRMKVIVCVDIYMCKRKKRPTTETYGKISTARTTKTTEEN